MAGTEEFPLHVTIDNSDYEYEKILKEDFFSVNVLYREPGGKRYVLKLSNFRFVAGFLFRPLAALMSRHEYRIYQRLEDVSGIPQLGPRFGRRGYFHEYIDGKTLAEWNRNAPLPADFFDRLAAIITECHRRRIYYADLDKRGNIIVGQGGKPWLIDFQICLHFKNKGSSNGYSNRIFNRLIREDIYHLYKHKRRFQPERLTETEKRLAQRSPGGQRFNRWFGNPFRRLKRLIYPAGSNETIWYKWRK